MFYPIGIFGPSFVGKTSFGRFLVDNGHFERLPIWTNRPPRSVENDPDRHFMTERKWLNISKDDDWIVNKIGPYNYAMDISKCHAMLAKTHVIVGITSSTMNSVKRVIPDLLTVLLWPEDFSALQKALALSKERPLNERNLRLAMNAQDARAELEADLTLKVVRFEDMNLRMQHFSRLQAQLLNALKQ